jgi:hypothetical protein
MLMQTGHHHLFRAGLNHAAGQQPSQIRFANASQYFLLTTLPQIGSLSLSGATVGPMMRECRRLC